MYSQKINETKCDFNKYSLLNSHLQSTENTSLTMANWGSPTVSSEEVLNLHHLNNKQLLTPELIYYPEQIKNINNFSEGAFETKDKFIETKCIEITIKNASICNFYKENPHINIETVNLYIIELIRPFIHNILSYDSQKSSFPSKPINEPEKNIPNDFKKKEETFLDVHKTNENEKYSEMKSKNINNFGEGTNEILETKCRENKIIELLTNLIEKLNLPSLSTVNGSSPTRRSGEFINNFNVDLSFRSDKVQSKINKPSSILLSREYLNEEKSNHKNILLLLNKLYTTGNILPVNYSTMMFSRKPVKNYSVYSDKPGNTIKCSPKKKDKMQFFKTIDNSNKTESKDFQNKNIEKDYFSLTEEGKHIFEDKYDLDHNLNQIDSLSEYELCIIKRTNKCNILVESKNTEINVNNEEIQEFIQLMEENNCHGLFLSQNSGFFSKQDFHIEIYNKLIVVYVHNVKYNEQKIKMAINIIDNLAIKIRELHRHEDIYEVIIDKETLEEINKEYQTFIQQKENLINIFKENQKQFFIQIDEFKFPELNKYLSTKFSIPTNKQGFKCELCKKFNGNNLKALAAHKRGCLRKVKHLSGINNFCEGATEANDEFIGTKCKEIKTSSNIYKKKEDGDFFEAENKKIKPSIIVED
jgi:hypothetical protein